MMIDRLPGSLLFLGAGFFIVGLVVNLILVSKNDNPPTTITTKEDHYPVRGGDIYCAVAFGSLTISGAIFMTGALLLWFRV